MVTKLSGTPSIASVTLPRGHFLPPTFNPTGYIKQLCFTRRLVLFVQKTAAFFTINGPYSLYWSRGNIQTTQLSPQNLINFLTRGKPFVTCLNVIAKRFFWANRPHLFTTLHSHNKISTPNLFHNQTLISNELFYTSFIQTLQTLRQKSAQVFHVFNAIGQNTVFLSTGQITIFVPYPCPDNFSCNWCTLHNGHKFCWGAGCLAYHNSIDFIYLRYVPWIISLPNLW